MTWIFFSLSGCELKCKMQTGLLMIWNSNLVSCAHFLKLCSPDFMRNEILLAIWHSEKKDGGERGF